MQRRSFLGAIFKSCALVLLPGNAAARVADRAIAPFGVSAISTRSVAGTGEQFEPTAPSDAYAATLPELAPVSSQAKIPSRAMLLQTSPVAGFQYHQGELLWAFMRCGDRLALVREPDNEHDDKAVRIEWSRFKLGYVPRLENHAVSQMLDRGEKLATRIVELRRSRNPWKRVQVAIEVMV